MSALESMCSLPLRSSALTSTTRSTRLDAVGAGIHPQRPADAAGNAVVEMEAADAGLLRRRGDALVGRGGTRPDAGRRNHLRLAKAFCGQPHDEAGDAAFADQKVRADADDGERHIFGDQLEERRQILLVGRLKQRIGKAAGAEPGDLVHLGVGRDAAAQGAQAVAKSGKQGGAAVHAGDPPSSLGSA